MTVPAGPAGLPPAARLPLLALGFATLLLGISAGLARLGVALAAPAAGLVALHGPLMVCGFFGIVIALERAVAVGRAWPYLGPLLAALGIVALLAWGSATGAPLLLASSGVLLAATADVLRRQPALFTLTLVLGAGCLVVGNALWALGAAPAVALPWWLAFLVLTIAGERLELSRFVPTSGLARGVFAALVGAVGAGLLASGHAAAAPLFGLGLLGLAAWLLRHDVARRTVKGRGLTRFIAVCLLAGYAWLALGGALWSAGAAAGPGSAAHDAALHAIALGFVFSMVFGHAAIILPAVTRLAVPYHPVFYVPLALLHASLVVRLGGDAAGRVDWTRAGALLNALALVAFLGVTAAAVLRGRRARRVDARSRQAGAVPQDPAPTKALR